MKHLFTLLLFVVVSLNGFSQDFMVDGLRYAVIQEGDCYFDDSEKQDDWYDGNCVALTQIENAMDGHDLTIPSKVVSDGREYAVKAIAPSTFKDAKLGTVRITNGVIGVFFNNAHIKKLIFEDGTNIVGTSYNDYTGDEYGLTLPGAVIEDIYYGRAVSNRVNSNYCAFMEAGVKSFVFGKNMDRVPIGFLMGNPIAKVDLPSNVKGVLYLAFKDCKELETVLIDSLQGPIYEEAFAGCENLKRVEIKKCSDIGDKAFYGCSSLEEVRIPSGVVVIGDSAFADCSNLKTVSLPNSLLHLGASFSFWRSFWGSSYYGSIVGNTFAGCLSLQKIELCAPCLIECMHSNFDSSVYQQATLCVPVGSMEAYSKVDGWNAFSQIEEKNMAKDGLCSLLIRGCGYDSWSGCRHVEATIDGEKVQNDGGEVFYRKMGDVVSLEFSSGYCEDRDNKPCDLDSVFVNGKNVTNQLQGNTLTLKVDRSMDIFVTYKLHEEDTGVSQVELDGISISVNGRKVELQNAHIGDDICVFDISGRKILATKVENSKQTILLPSSGIYVIQVGGVRRKVAVK